MAQFDKILFTTDFSDCAEHATQYAFALAKSSGGALHIAHVIDDGYQPYMSLYAYGAISDPALGALRQLAEENLAKIADRARNEGIETHAHLLQGRSSLEITHLAKEIKADLVIAGTHGRSGFDKVLFGSTCERLIRLSPAPVLSIKHPEHEFVDKASHISLNRVLFPTDFSEYSNVALPVAVALCREHRATLMLSHVIDSRLDYPQLVPDGPRADHRPLHDKAQWMLAEMALELPDIETQIEVVTGVPHREIQRTVETANIDLVVMATHGRTGLAHALLGSTAEKVVRVVGCPIITVRSYRSAFVRDVIREVERREKTGAAIGL